MRRCLVIGMSLCCLVAATAAWAAPQPSTTFKGKTSQKEKVSIRSGGDGLTLKGFKITREFDCGAGTEPVAGTFRQSGGQIAVNLNGGFKARGKVEGTSSGKIKTGEFRMKGRFGPRGRVATGVYRERIELSDGTECGTGRVTFRVRAQ